MNTGDFKWYPVKKKKWRSKKSTAFALFQTRVIVERGLMKGTTVYGVPQIAKKTVNKQKVTVNNRDISVVHATTKKQDRRKL